MHTAVVCAVWLTQTQSLSLCSDQVILLWKEFGVKDDQVLLQHIKALGESMGAVKSTPLLVNKMGRVHEGNYSDKMRLEDMMEVIL